MMANQGSKPSLDGIVRTRPAGQNVVPARSATKPQPQQPVRPAPRPAVAEPPQPKLVRRAVADVEEEAQFVDQPEKSSRWRKVIKTVVVLLVLAAFAFGIWWVYLSYFA